MIKKIKNRVRGFTLIEILVVIAIIVLLFSIIVGSLQAARQKMAINKIAIATCRVRLALEEYYNDHGKYPGNYGTYCLGTGCIYFGQQIDAKMNLFDLISKNTIPKTDNSMLANALTPYLPSTIAQEFTDAPTLFGGGGEIKGVVYRVNDTYASSANLDFGVSGSYVPPCGRRTSWSNGTDTLYTTSVGAGNIEPDPNGFYSDILCGGLPCGTDLYSGVGSTSGGGGGGGGSTSNTIIYGCTDPAATNYNSSATADDGSCTYGSGGSGGGGGGGGSGGGGTGSGTCDPGYTYSETVIPTVDSNGLPYDLTQTSCTPIPVPPADCPVGSTYDYTYYSSGTWITNTYNCPDSVSS